MSIPTPHIEAKNGDFARTVLMPGDPMRAKYIAEKYLEDTRVVNMVRGIHGYTGIYKGKEVSVMASGMGIPSIGIYSYELYNMYDVEQIIRIGSAGGLTENVKVRDIVFGMGACTNSNYANQFSLPGSYAPICSYELLKEAIKVADGMDSVNYHVGNLISSDTFYDDNNSGTIWSKMGVLAVEMEAAGLYMNAARAGKKALAICTISDNLITGEATSSKERETTFDDMMKIALEIA